MGNNPPKPQSKSNLEEEIKISHERFERYKYVPVSDLLQITVDVPDERQMKVWENDVSKSINGFQSKDSLMLPIRHEYQPKGWCGNTGSAKIYYENFPYLFSEEIENRRSIAKFFDEEEIWYLLYNLVSAARDFQGIGRKIGDVRPHNIFINESGQIKIGNVFSWPYEKTNFQKTAYEKELTFVSPQEMGLLEKGKLDNTTNKVLSESFSIGLTLLETGLLFNAGELYSLNDKEINIAKLRGKLNEWSTHVMVKENGLNVGYSNLLKVVVAALCEPDVSKRVKSVEIEELLRPYDKEIMNLEEFDKNIEAHYPLALRNFLPQKIEAPRPQEQLYYSQTVHAYPQQINNFPPQGYRVTNVVNPAPVQINYAPIQVKREVVNQQVVRVNQNYQGNQPQNFQNQTIHRQVVHQYIPASQPQTIVPTQTFQSQFHKYPVIQSQVRPVYEATKTFNTKTEPVQLRPVSDQFSSSPLPPSSDFLRKIDQQLQNSRKFYPS